MDIINISPVGKTPYYALYKNGKYVRYIVTAEVSCCHQTINEVIMPDI